MRVNNNASNIIHSDTSDSCISLRGSKTPPERSINHRREDLLGLDLINQLFLHHLQAGSLFNFHIKSSILEGHLSTTSPQYRDRLLRCLGNNIWTSGSYALWDQVIPYSFCPIPILPPSPSADPDSVCSEGFREEVHHHPVTS